MAEKIEKTDKEWEKELTEERYKIMRQGGTETPFTGEYVHTKEKGMYACAACGNELFSSEAKFDSGTGWPSFDQALPGAVEFRPDNSQGMSRTEIICARCGSHLGHIFDDLPAGRQADRPKKLRYCVNSVCLNLKKHE